MYMKRQSEFFPIFGKNVSRVAYGKAFRRKTKKYCRYSLKPRRIEKAGNGEQAEFTLVSPLAWLLSVCVRLTN